jgi:hypothetical protein
MIKKLALFCLLTSMGLFAISQEYLNGMVNNPVIQKKHAQYDNSSKSLPGVHLPFFDDFSGSDDIFPKSGLWKDRLVFVNKTYPVNPPTLGVATFDVINDTGALYPYATTTPFIADTLTSRDIRLDSSFVGPPAPLTLGDSLYFSFYYQPQGVGDAPSAADSLILEFYDNVQSKWHKVWASPGMTLATFKTLHTWDFKIVMIPIKNPNYLNAHFKFRFKNYGSIAPLSIPSWQSNCDQWNIDYVYLNKNRSKNDSTFADIAFVDNAKSMLKNYTSMPARHFSNAELATNFTLKEVNLNNILTNMYYQYVVTQQNGPFTSSYTGGVADILQFKPNGFHNDPNHINPVINFTLPSLSGQDSAVFFVKHSIKSNGFTDLHKENDTLLLKQEFYNYYSYDDGTAENGYGVSGANSKVAYKFNFNQADTLGGVQIYFNQTLNSAYSKYFYLMVWSSLSPETLIYKSKKLRPEFEDSINMFYTYLFSDTTILVNGSVYIGWQQTTDENLNVGYDRNTNSNQNLYYNVAGTWSNSSFTGSLMMRPLVGKAWQQTFSSVAETNNAGIDFEIYPNPAAQQEIHISVPQNYLNQISKDNLSIKIFDCVGKTVLAAPYSESINISELKTGLYFVRLSGKNTPTTRAKKLLITQ